MTTFQAEPFTSAWVDELVALSSDRESIAGLSGIVGLGVGAKLAAADAEAVVAIVDGRAVGASTELPEITIPFAKNQVSEWLAGEVVLSEAYMKGDLKPVGASGPLFAALELLDWVVSQAD